MGKYWKTSIAVSYVPREIEEMIERIKYNNWRVVSDFMDLTIIKN